MSDKQDEGFYIMSIDGSPAGGNVLWWKPNNAGYTTDLNTAGVYTAQQIADDSSYYNNPEKTQPVRVSQARLYARQSVPYEFKNSLFSPKNK